MQLPEKTTVSNLDVGETYAGLAMTPGEALDKTLKLFAIKAKSLASASEVSEQAISKFRNGHQDMQASTVFRIIAALPRSARFYFYSLIEPDVEDPEEIVEKVAATQTSGNSLVVEASPPSPYTSYLWQWLSLNRISPAEFEQRLTDRGLSTRFFREILNGREPTLEEQNHLSQVMNESANG